MEDEILEEEMHIMEERSEKVKVLDSNTFKKPVSEIRVGKPICLEAGQSVEDAIAMMQVKQFGCVLVVDDGKLVGILTERDIISKAIGTGKDLHDIPVEEVMTPKPQAFQADDSLAFVMNAMTVGGYRHIPIVDVKNQPLAVVSVKDIVSFIVEHFSEEILNLPPKPLRNVKTQDGG